MHRSLTVKLILAFLLVAITGTILAAIFLNIWTEREFDRFVANRYEADLIAELQNRYQEAGSWQEIVAIVVRGRHPWEIARAPITLVDQDRRVVYSQAYETGQQLTQQEIQKAVPISVQNAIVGWVLFPRANSSGPRPGTPEAIFLSSMRWAIILGSLVAIMVALLLGVLLARTLTQPLHELTEATRALAQGALGRQVPVRSNDELGELTAAFNNMSADLAQSTRQRRQMTADIAHDLRTPLSVILGYTEALSDGKIPGSAAIYRVLHGEAEHLQHLIEDLRLLSLADAGELSLNCLPTIPRSLLERTAVAHAVAAKGNGLDLQVNVTPDLPEIVVDPERMAQVLGNLVNNAIRHTPSGGTIQLSAHGEGGRVLLNVTDSGEGIDPADLPYVFDRFYRADPSRSLAAGESGLGLAIARSLVEAHNGHISVTSNRGQGTTFTVALPVSPPMQTGATGPQNAHHLKREPT